MRLSANKAVSGAKRHYISGKMVENVNSITINCWNFPTAMICITLKISVKSSVGLIEAR